MSRKILGISIVLAVVLLLVAFWQMSQTAEQNVPANDLMENNEQSVDDSQKVEVNETGKETMKVLLARQENLECAIKYKNPDSTSASSEGTFFTSRGRMRGDFIVNDGSNKVLSAMIIVDQKMYSWTEIDGQKYGMQVDLAEMEKMQGAKPDTKEAVPLDQQVNYECKPWKSVDSSIFEPPKDIVFTDFGQVMKAGMEYGTSYDGEAAGSGQCELCLSLSDAEAKKQCLAAMACE